MPDQGGCLGPRVRSLTRGHRFGPRQRSDAGSGISPSDPRDCPSAAGRARRRAPCCAWLPPNGLRGGRLRRSMKKLRRRSAACARRWRARCERVHSRGNSCSNKRLERGGAPQHLAQGAGQLEQLSWQDHGELECGRRPEHKANRAPSTTGTKRGQNAGHE